MPGERLLWSGRPPSGLISADFDWGTLGLAALALLILYLTTGGEFHAIPLDQGIHFLIPFGLAVLASLAFLMRPFFRRRILYAVTNQRVLILGRRRRDRVESHDLAWLPMLVLEEQDGRGTITIEEDPTPNGCLHLRLLQAAGPEKGFAFFRIRDPHRVHDIIVRHSRERRAELLRDRDPQLPF